MDRITTAIITDRLGGSPEQWTFFGQCFDAREQNGLKCAILQQQSQYFFTLKSADGGPDRRLISLEAISLFTNRNPELHRMLKVGVAFLSSKTTDSIGKRGGARSEVSATRNRRIQFPAPERRRGL